MQGTCLKFNRAGGYGFIVSKDDPTLPDIFVHFSDIEHNQYWKRRFLMPGFNVTFDIEFEPDDVDHDRPYAKRVCVVPPITIAKQTAGRP